MEIIKDLKILHAIEKQCNYDIQFDDTFKYCIRDNRNCDWSTPMKYKGQVYKLKYFSGCFCPYLVKEEV